MAFKKLFQGPGKGQELEIDELIVLKKYEEAEARLEARLKKNPRDLHSRLKAAQVYTQQRKVAKAIEHYKVAAEAYSQDGFHDKAIAVLATAVKVAPGDPALAQRMERLKRAKERARTGGLAVQALKDGQRGAPRKLLGMELDRIWENLAETEFVDQLPEEQVKRFFSVVEVVQIKADATVVEVQAQRPEILLIASGSVEAVVENPGAGHLTLRSFVAGDLLGEGALLEHRPWPATYRATEPATLLRLTRQGLEKAMLGNSDPRQLLDSLRRQGNDRQVLAAIQQMQTQAAET